MVRSKLSTIVSVLSLLIAVGAIVTLFSVRKAESTGNSRLSAASYGGESPALSETPLPIDPAIVNFREAAKIATDFKKVSALAVDEEDRIYVAGDMSMCRFSPQGKLEMRIALPYPPTCLTVANRHHLAPGRIYVGFTDHVEVFDSNGAKVSIWQGLGAEARFTSISTSEQYIFIADAGQNVVQRFDWTGKLLESFGESSPGHFTSAYNGANAPFDLVVGLDDLVYVVNRRDHRVEGYGFDGRLESHWGQRSSAVEDFAGESNPAHLAIMADGRFATAEETPLRVKVYVRSREDGAVVLDGAVCGPEETGPVAGLATDQHQRILVLDGEARCVRVFEATRRPVRQKQIQLGRAE